MSKRSEKPGQRWWRRMLGLWRRRSEVASWLWRRCLVEAVELVAVFAISALGPVLAEWTSVFFASEPWIFIKYFLEPGRLGFSFWRIWKRFGDHAPESNRGAKRRKFASQGQKDLESNLMSKSKLGRNPFKPGPATKPAHMAGRGEELGVIENTLEEIAGPRDEKTGLLLEPGLAPVKIVGPRGVGKTTLLAEAKRMAQARGIHVVWIENLPNLEPDGALVENILAGLKAKGRLLNIQRVLKQIASLKVGPVSVGLSNNRQETLISDALEACMEQRPLALLLDEAMEYDPEILGTLLQISQRMIVQEHPLALLLAGTPNLDRNLNKTKASFIDRTEDLYVNDLTPEAAQEALLKPFADINVEVDDKALKLMVKMTDNYPFFTQIVGLEVWKAMAASGLKKVDLAIVRRAEAGIKRRRQGFYKKAYGKMVEFKIIAHARTVMKVLELNGGRAIDEVILDSLARDDSEAEQDRALDIFHKLVDRGFIWSKDDEMEAGIPSFFSYCQEQARKKEKQKKAVKQKAKPSKQASRKRASTKKAKN